MNWENIVGQAELKRQLIDSINANRVGHAYLFVGREGYGGLPLALAFAKHLFAVENNTAAEKIQHLNHVDLHFSFPVFSEKNKSTSNRLFPIFREMVLKNPYFSLEDWVLHLESANKQFFISTSEIEEQMGQFTLKSYEGGGKVLIVWRADKMNVMAANKLLKFLEEPPEKTTILMTAESIQDVLPTILSRVQLIEVPMIADEDLLDSDVLAPLDFQKKQAFVASAQGDYNTLLSLIEGNGTEEFEDFFIQWVRQAFQVRKKPEMLRYIILWARTVASWNREKQKSFLAYCTDIFRMALLQNYGQEALVYKTIKSNGFQWEGFSKFIHGANIVDIIEQLSDAEYHLERNANPKIVWTDMGIRLSRYLHKKG